MSTQDNPARSDAAEFDHAIDHEPANAQSDIKADVQAKAQDVMQSSSPASTPPHAGTAPHAGTVRHPVRTRLSRYALMASVPLLLAAIGGYFYLTSGQSVSTDNAYVQQSKISISSEIGGRIVEVAVQEDQVVRAGDLLFRIDAQPFRLSVDSANAEIASAQAKVSTLATTADTSSVEIATANEAVHFAQSDLARERALMARGFNTRTRMDAAEHALAQARGQLAAAQASATRARAALATGSIAPGVNPGVLAAQTRREQAMYQLSRTEVRAPIAGIVSQADRLQVGQMMVAGLPAVSIVANGQSWVEANFKETDLNHMAVGQRATLTFDAYPDIELSGHVASIGAGTGSEFSVLPAQNATGNWVKVTQRVPVRVAIDGQSPRQLLAGLSAHVTVHFDGAERR